MYPYVDHGLDVAPFGLGVVGADHAVLGVRHHHKVVVRGVVQHHQALTDQTKKEILAKF